MINIGGNQVINYGNAPGIYENTLANIPASANQGTIFIATDTNSIYCYLGGAWVIIGGGGGGSQTWQQTLDVAAGNILTHDNLIDAAGTALTFNNVNGFNINIETATAFKIFDNTDLSNPLLYSAKDIFMVQGKQIATTIPTLYIYNDGALELIGNDGTFASDTLQIDRYGNAQFLGIYFGVSSYPTLSLDRTGVLQLFANNISTNQRTLLVDVDGHTTISGVSFPLSFPTLDIDANGNFAIEGNDGTSTGATLTVDRFGALLLTSLFFPGPVGLQTFEINVNGELALTGNNGIGSSQTLLVDSFGNLQLSGNNAVSSFQTFSVDQYGFVSVKMNNTAASYEALSIDTDGTLILSTLNGGGFGSISERFFVTAGAAVTDSGFGNTKFIVTDGAVGSIDPSAVSEVTSTTRGFLPPRMTTAQKNAIAAPAHGLLVYDTTLQKLCVRGAASWETITSV
jgi:hypothetical protein